VTGPPAEPADVVIVGAGPAGLTAARYLRAAGVPSVLVLEREAQPGGIPRHSHHLGYGLRDLRTAWPRSPDPLGPVHQGRSRRG
jgi:cation diffusion facilitator CzcD-associated flavoprotein CzcO